MSWLRSLVNGIGNLWSSMVESVAGLVVIAVMVTLVLFIPVTCLMFGSAAVIGALNCGG